MSIHEPATLATDYLLALLGFAGGFWLGEGAGPAQRWWRRALWLSGAAALVGGTYHGFGPSMGESAAGLVWRATLLLLVLTAATMGMTLVTACLPPARQQVGTAIVWIKSSGCAVLAMVQPIFLIAILDYGLTMLALAAAALFVRRPWSLPMVAGVAFSILGAVVQQAGWAPAHHFNHNDLFHVIQAIAIGFFFQAGRRLHKTSEKASDPASSLPG